MIDSIRPLYRPLQPGTRPTDKVSYREQIPHPLLQPYVFCYWELASTGYHSIPYQYQVVADGCIDVFFNLLEPVESLVMGFCASHTAFSLEGNFHYAGIRFMPGMFPLLFNVDAYLLSNRAEALKDVLPSLTDLAPQLHTGTHPTATFDNHLLRILSQARVRTDARVFEAIERICQSQGDLRVEQDLSTGISPRQLRRLFLRHVGGTPKSFSQVIRFQHMLRTNLNAGTGSKIFFGAAYHDQAHFIREFTKLYGQLPAAALSR